MALTCLIFSETPSYRNGVPEKVETARAKDLANPSRAIMIRGRVLDEQCNPLNGAILNMWYSLDSPLKYGVCTYIVF